MVNTNTKSDSLTRPPVNKKYFTAEDRKKAHAEASKRYYEKQKERDNTELENQGTQGTAGDILEVVTTDQMLEAMRSVYKSMGGTKQLLKHMKDNPRDYVAMVQNLMKVEAALQEQKLKQQGGDDARGVFVVLKGLEGADPICPHCKKNINLVNDTTNDVKDTTGNIDMASMENVLNPGVESVIREGGDW